MPAGLNTDPVAHDAWFRARVREALEDSRHPMLHEDVEARFETRRNKARHISPKTFHSIKKSLKLLIKPGKQFELAI